MVSLETLSDMIDITAVAADTRLADVDRICDIAKAYHCASTITLPCYLARTMKNTIGYELLHDKAHGLLGVMHRPAYLSLREAVGSVEKRVHHQKGVHGHAATLREGVVKGKLLVAELAVEERVAPRLLVGFVHIVSFLYLHLS